MKIPKALKIGYKYFSILKENSDSENLNEEDIVCLGRIFYDYQRIYINKDYPKNVQENTLIHEVIHGIDQMNQIGLSEEQVIRLANGISTLLDDNNIKVNI